MTSVPASGAPSAARKIAGVVLFLVVVVACARLSFFHAFSSMKTWDDEGYFLLALREFGAHGGLYERVRGVFYGPFYFESIVGLSWITGLDADTANARWLMILAWFAGCAGAAWAAWRSTRAFVAPSLVVVVALPYLLTYTDEPLHATSVVLPLVAPLLVLFAGPLGDGRARGLAPYVACGALCGALVLVKANLGGCLALGVAAILAGRARGRVGAWARIASVPLLLGSPFALTSQLLHVDWVLDFALLVSIALVPFCVEFVRRDPLRGDERAIGAREWGATLAGAVVVCAASIAIALATGTTWAGLWRALVVEAAQFAAKNHYDPGLPPRALILASALPIAVAFVVRERPVASALLRLAASAYVLHEGVHGRMLYAALPFLWIAASGGPERHALGLFAVLSVLQVYPIPGSQIGLYALLATTVGAIGIVDAVRSLPWSRRVPRPVAAAVVALLLAGVALSLAHVNPRWKHAAAARERWSNSVPLDLPGTRPLRLPEMEAARLRWVSENLRLHADAYVGVPGMHSFHAWSGVAAPMPFYKHHWVLFRDDEEEAALARGLLGEARTCVVRNDDLLRFWLHDDLPDGPVKRVLDAEYRQVGAAGNYRLLVRPSQAFRPVLDARPVDVDDELRARFGEGRAFRLTLPPLGDAIVARMTVVHVGTELELLDTAATDASRRLVVLDASREPLLATDGARLPGTRGKSSFLVLWPPLDRPLRPRGLLVRAYDGDGAIVARCLFQALDR